jgi:hypothetical protein
MKYVIYDNLINWAIFLGKDNIKLINKKYNIKLYYFEYKDIQIWIPQLVNTSNIPINIDLEQTILKHYPELSECKRIVTLNDMNLELSNSYIEKYKKDSVLVHLQLQGDAAQCIFNDENVKTITSTYFNSDAGKNISIHEYDKPQNFEKQAFTKNKRFDNSLHRNGNGYFQNINFEKEKRDLDFFSNDNEWNYLKKLLMLYLLAINRKK